jgi:hypothetical protein
MSWRTWFQRSPHPQKFRPFGFFGFVLVVGGGWGLVSGVSALSWHTAQNWQAYADWADLLQNWLLGLATWLAGGVWFGLIAWFGIAWSLRRQLRSSGRDPNLTADEVERS